MEIIQKISVHQKLIHRNGYVARFVFLFSGTAVRTAYKIHWTVDRVCMCI